jgi:hypothetical protein
LSSSRHETDCILPFSFLESDSSCQGGQCQFGVPGSTNVARVRSTCACLLFLLPSRHTSVGATAERELCYWRPGPPEPMTPHRPSFHNSAVTWLRCELSVPGRLFSRVGGRRYTDYPLRHLRCSGLGLGTVLYPRSCCDCLLQWPCPAGATIIIDISLLPFPPTRLSDQHSRLQLRADPEA